MKLLTPLVLAVLLAHGATAPVAAQSPGVSLAWDSCIGDGGVLLRTFACDTNAGADVLVCSFTAPAGVTAFVAVEAVVSIIACGQANWWQIRNAGACRSNSLTLQLSPPDDATNCLDPWQGLALGFVNYTFEYNSNYDYSVGSLRLAMAIPAESAVALVEGSEYFAFRLRLDHQKAVGAATCSGCASIAELHAYRIQLSQVSPAEPHLIIGMPLGPAAWQAPGSCAPDPVRNRTWGAVKELFR